LLEVGVFAHLLHELFEGHFIENLIGRFGKAFIDETDGSFAGGEIAGNDALFFLDAESAFEAADEITYADFARGSGEAIPPAAAHFAFEESAATQGEEDCFEELIGEVFRLGEIARLDESSGPEAGELDNGA
jgi:hypothetical protein